MTPFSNIPGLQILLLTMLAFATLAFTLLAIVTVSNAWRLRNPLISWHSGKLKGYPLFATIFLVFSVAVTIILIVAGRTGTTPMMLCYSWISVMWLFSSFHMSKRYITDNGIVKNVNDPSQTVVWGNINDYIENTAKGGTIFVFFYLHPASTVSERHITRLELFVPDHKIEAFQKLLNFKLRRRFTKESVYSKGYEQLN
jgi:hypothetical protein